MDVLQISHGSKAASHNYYSGKSIVYGLTISVLYLRVSAKYRRCLHKLSQKMAPRRITRARKASRKNPSNVIRTSTPERLQTSTPDSSQDVQSSSDSAPSPPRPKKRKMAQKAPRIPHAGKVPKPKPKNAAKEVVTSPRQLTRARHAPMGDGSKKQSAPVQGRVRNQARIGKIKNVTAVLGNNRNFLTAGNLIVEKSAFFGTDNLKEKVWKTMLDQAVEIMRGGDELGDEAKRKAEETVLCLATKKKAREAGRISLKNYEYFNEDRVRTVICVAFEDSVPGNWTCGWSSDRVRKISQILSLLVGGITRTESRILRGMPIFVISSILDIMFTSDNGLSIKAWGEARFRKQVNKSVQKCIGASYEQDGTSTIDTTIVKSSLDLLTILCKKVKPLFEGKNIRSTKEVLRLVRKSIGDGYVTGVKWSNEEINETMNLVSVISPTLYYELFPHIWDKYSENRPKVFALETFVLDILYLLRDIYGPILIWQDSYWNKYLQDLMFEMGAEEDRGFHELDFAKVFLLLNLLHGDGIAPEQVDTKIVANQLVGRINTQGVFYEQRIRESIPQRYKRRLAVERCPKEKPAPKKVGRFAAF